MRSFGHRSLSALAGLTLSLAACDDGPASSTDAGASFDASPPATDTGVADTGVTVEVDRPRPPDPTPYEGPDDWCPGRDHCRGMGDGRLSVGFAREPINPTLVEREWEDRNNNHLWEENEPYTDANRNGVFDATWVAGFSNGRPATGLNDSLDVRAIAFRHNDTVVAFAVIDCVGLMNTDIDRIRADATLQGLGIDKVIVASTHTHQGVDTLGIWGSRFGVSGRSDVYQALVRQRTALALRRAVEALRPARMRVAQSLTVDPVTGDTRDYVNDTRDPVLFDPTLTVVQFIDDAEPTRTLGTWVNWAAHPEYAGSRNNLLSADYVHFLRDAIERGLPELSVPGLGGTTVFVNGALGGQVGPGGGVHPRGDTGMIVTESGIARARAAGRSVGRLALRAITTEGVEARDVSLSYRTAQIFARAENFTYGIAYNRGIFDRELFNFDPTRPLRDPNFAWVRSRVTYLQVGPVATITAPGELHPELWIGYDMRFSWGQPTLTETENRPDLSMAPRPPYLRELMLQNPGVRYAFVSGLSEDFLGYIIPAFNFVLNSGVPYLLEAAGDHYEETNAIGPEVERFLQHPMMHLARWRAPAR